MNTVSLIGRLTADPLTRAGSDHESATFRLAVPRGGSDTADFVDVVTFDALARTVGEHLTKGRRVAVVGRLRHSTWKTADGENRSKLGVVAAGVMYLDAKPQPEPDHGSDPAGDGAPEPDWPAR
ncbi:MAG: single-stranded DNA-binding protein, partial [Acidimicrobiia bacterium]